jgi:hypothetical protein
MARRWFSTRSDSEWGAPVTWQGWAVVLAWVGIVAIGAMSWANGRMATNTFTLLFAGATVVALGAYWLKGARYR